MDKIEDVDENRKSYGSLSLFIEHANNNKNNKKLTGTISLPRDRVVSWENLSYCSFVPIRKKSLWMDWWAVCIFILFILKSRKVCQIMQWKVFQVRKSNLKEWKRWGIRSIDHLGPTTGGLGVRPSGPPRHFYWPPILDRAFNMGGRFNSVTLQIEMFFYVFFEMSIISRFPSTIHQIERFEVRHSKNFLGRGSVSPFPRPLPRSFSGFALDSGFAHFAPDPQQTWLRPCLDQYKP